MEKCVSRGPSAVLLQRGTGMSIVDKIANTGIDNVDGWRLLNSMSP
jgi:hypothetical protein